MCFKMRPPLRRQVRSYYHILAPTPQSSTVNCAGPRQHIRSWFQVPTETMTNLCTFPERLCVWRLGSLFLREEGLVFFFKYASYLLHCNFARVYPHSRSVQVSSFALWTPYTLCHFAIMNNIYSKYTQQASAGRLDLNLFYHSETVPEFIRMVYIRLTSIIISGR
jgi:hypothetical protein